VRLPPQSNDCNDFPPLNAAFHQKAPPVNVSQPLSLLAPVPISRTRHLQIDDDSQLAPRIMISISSKKITAPRIAPNIEFSPKL
jgi:hypothetical protein